MGKREQYATRMLEALQDQDGRWMTTKGVLIAAGIPQELQSPRLQDLHELARIGTIKRQKNEKGTAFCWKILTKDWDRNAPFAYVPGMERLEEEEKKPDGEGDADRPSRRSEKDRVLIESLRSRIDRCENEINDLHEKCNRQNGTIEVKHWDGEIKKLKGVTLPKIFQDVIDLATARRNILLVGPAGCGKTHLARLVADSLGLDFGSLSCSAGMSETHLLGRSIPDFHEGKAKFQGTEFLRVYEGGGVFLMDEVDAADSNLLLAINSAIANDYCNVPNRPDNPHAKRHDDFIIIASANTFGRGATRVYAGRNQLDEATLDRFRMGLIEVDYDRAVEETKCPNSAMREHFWRMRENINRAGLRRILSTRFMADAYVMHKTAKWDLRKICEHFFSGWNEDEKNKVAVPLPMDKTESATKPTGHGEEEPADLMRIASAKPIMKDGAWHCPHHGPMVRMKSDRGYRCSQAGKFDIEKRTWSNCNCGIFDKDTK